ncbi:MAG: hypothetical protein ABUL72_06270 [Armatimonadota bacterium]
MSAITMSLAAQTQTIDPYQAFNTDDCQLGLLTRNDVATELNLSQTQKDSIIGILDSAFRQGWYTGRSEDRWGDNKGQNDTASMNPGMWDMQNRWDVTEHQAMNVLDERQRRRLRQIFIQQNRGLALGDMDIRRMVGLSGSRADEADRLLAARKWEKAGWRTDANGHRMMMGGDYGNQLLMLLNEEETRRLDRLAGRRFHLGSSSDSYYTHH